MLIETPIVIWPGSDHAKQYFFKDKPRFDLKEKKLLNDWEDKEPIRTEVTLAIALCHRELIVTPNTHVAKASRAIRVIDRDVVLSIDSVEVRETVPYEVMIYGYEVSPNGPERLVFKFAIAPNSKVPDVNSFRWSDDLTIKAGNWVDIYPIRSPKFIYLAGVRELYFYLEDFNTSKQSTNIRVSFYFSVLEEEVWLKRKYTVDPIGAKLPQLPAIWNGIQNLGGWMSISEQGLEDSLAQHQEYDKKQLEDRIEKELRQQISCRLAREQRNSSSSWGFSHNGWSPGRSSTPSSELTDWYGQTAAERDADRKRGM